jgi:hypothetical protein
VNRRSSSWLLAGTANDGCIGIWNAPRFPVPDQGCPAQEDYALEYACLGAMLLPSRSPEIAGASPAWSQQADRLTLAVFKNRLLSLKAAKKKQRPALNRSHVSNRK